MAVTLLLDVLCCSVFFWCNGLIFVHLLMVYSLITLLHRQPCVKYESGELETKVQCRSVSVLHLADRINNTNQIHTF